MHNKIFYSITLWCFLASLAFAAPPGNANASLSNFKLVHSVPHIEGLTVIPYNRSIQIVSEESITLYFFDRNVELVFVKKMPAGSNLINLESQKQGIYYAVVQVGELMRVVKVVVI